MTFSSSKRENVQSPNVKLLEELDENDEDENDPMLPSANICGGVNGNGSWFICIKLRTSSEAANDARGTKHATNTEQVAATFKKSKEADVQAAKPTPLTIDVAVQAGRQQQSLQLPPQAEQALRLPPVVKDLLS